jgi:hypothetical protein
MISSAVASSLVLLEPQNLQLLLAHLPPSLPVVVVVVAAAVEASSWNPYHHPDLLLLLLLVPLPHTVPAPSLPSLELWCPPAAATTLLLLSLDHAPSTPSLLPAAELHLYKISLELFGNAVAAAASTKLLRCRVSSACRYCSSDPCCCSWYCT